MFNEKQSDRGFKYHIIICYWRSRIRGFENIKSGGNLVSAKLEQIGPLIFESDTISCILSLTSTVFWHTLLSFQRHSLVFRMPQDKGMSMCVPPDVVSHLLQTIRAFLKNSRGKITVQDNMSSSDRLTELGKLGANFSSIAMQVEDLRLNTQGHVPLKEILQYIEVLQKCQEQ